jgi:hypothetical protein
MDAHHEATRSSLLTLGFHHALRTAGIHHLVNRGSLSQGDAAFAGMPADARPVAGGGGAGRTRPAGYRLRTTPASDAPTMGH